VALGGQAAGDAGAPHDHRPQGRAADSARRHEDVGRLLCEAEDDRAAPRHQAVEGRPQRADEAEHRAQRAGGCDRDPAGPRGGEAVADLVDARERDDEGDRQREACRQQRQAAERPEAVAVPRLTGAMVSS
jgi:hypothetical protein